MKRILRFALQQFGLHAGGMVAALFLIFTCGSLWPNVGVYQWFVTACAIFILVILLFIPATNWGIRDHMHDELLDRHGSDDERFFHEWNGFLAGFLGQIPALLFLLFAVLLPGIGERLSLVPKAWYFMFSRFFNYLGWPYIPVCLFGALFSAAVTGLAYLRGREMRIRTKMIIARNDRKRERQQKKPGA